MYQNTEAGISALTTHMILNTHGTYKPRACNPRGADGLCKETQEDSLEEVVSGVAERGQSQ